MHDRYRPYWEHAGNGHPLAWILFFVIFVLLIAVLALLAYRLFAGRHGASVTAVPGGAVVDPLDVVRMRYARGEIDRDQFLQATADLRAPPPA